MKSSSTTGYSASQIALHWIVAALVAFQLIFGESMAELFRAIQRGEPPPSNSIFWGNLHIWIGFAVLATVLLRLALRAGCSAPPETGTRTLIMLARITHIALYVVLIVTAATGVIAYYWVPALGEVHELGKPVILVLIGLHVAGALWHQFVRRDRLIMRMLIPRS